MQELNSFFREIPVLLILALAGYILYKTHILNAAVLKGFSGMLIYFTMPATILMSFINDIDRDIFKILPKHF
jgi:predicted permease